MQKLPGLALLLLLLVCQKANTDSQISCPYRCHCFTSAQILCGDGGISYLPRNVSRKVKEFILMSSDLQYLFSHTLAESTQLTKLVFLNNALRSIHSQAFEHLAELQELEISGNSRLDNLFPGTFEKLGNLTRLMLNYNAFKSMPPGMFDSLTQLETLQMRGNILSDLPPFLFRSLCNLFVLDLSLNKLTGSNLTADTFQNVSRLTELHLEGNNISELPDDVFFVLTELKVLNLRGNLLTAFSDRVFGFKASNLNELNLKGNKLKQLHPLGGLSSISNLVLSSNKLSSLPEEIFWNLTSLEYLDLSENQLASLPGTIFNGLLGMKTIHLNHNNLEPTGTPEMFEDQVLVEQLFLSNNRLEALPPGLLDHFTMQYTMRLHGNPWKCDCHMRYLHDFVLENSQNVETLDRMLCESPVFLKKRPVASIKRDQLVCSFSNGLGRCSQETHNHTTVFKCKVDKCSRMTVKVQFEEDDGSVKEHVLNLQPELSHCRNETT
uniref:LRRCT domain-containing protein n=1 Tax=Tetraodon nigroviridis TaxID=99883 RepID=H3CQX2_TETNG